MQTNSLYILFTIVLVLIFPVLSQAQEVKTKEEVRINAQRDSTITVSDSLTTATTKLIATPVQTDTIKKKPALLTDVVAYQAEDYMRLSPRENRMYLYDQAQITYGDLVITAGLIILDNEKNEVYAFGIPDSLGNYSQTPIFTQAQNTVRPDSIRFNFKSKKALVYNSKTEEGAFKVNGEITKRENDSVYFMQNVKFTTSENEEDPDYYFYARRIKFVPKKKIVTGLVNMYIADVPTPLGLPFGYFPLTEEETSGFIIPSFGQSNNRGYSLQNGGYYFAISEYADLLAVGDYYTNGSYGLRLESSYALRYKFRGNLSFRYENLLSSERGFPDFSQSSVYNLRWSHSQDSKSSPNSRFSASVNLGSSTYYQESVNQTNTANFLNNTLSSSVSYSKTFQGEPQVNVSVAATHTQNSNTGAINMTLPTVQGSVSRIYPLAPKLGTKKGIIENINFQYNFRGENRIQTFDSLFFKPQMFKDATYGAQHSIPISTNFKLLNYLSVSANANYQENWVFKTFDRSYDQENNVVVIDTIDGFDSFRTYNFSTSIGTTVYGMMNFGEDKKIQAIRHVMRPSISYSINPGFDQYYDQYTIEDEIDPTRNQVVDYTRFQGSLFGSPGQLYSSSIGMSISNTLEAKVRDKDSTAIEAKKIKLLNNFSVSTAYNLAADSLKLSLVSMRGSIPIIQDKLDINVGANLDIYALDNNNRRVDKLNINNGGSLFRMTSANVSFGYSLSSKDFELGGENKDKLENETFRNGGRPDDLFGKSTDLDGKFYDDEEDVFEKDEDKKKNEWYNYKIPWDLRLAYTMTYNNNARQNEISSHSIMFSGDVELAPKWVVGASSGFDIKDGGFTYTQLRFQRDLDSWRMSFNWVPFSARSSWFFFIGIKSSILSDIKYDKRLEPDRSL
ncbi:lipopolysaccharide assembly outer membrane protein LptD (OstA) [Gillisia mitskevichiae]|uniref:Lipopolysaccharide assembly outer membrane protein LptD (OstA) n=1 Tax=Gillisia mitskevichiae TaxID=270921 RepID=A0A495PU98_9FLAO|nr:putative LPS assembly protein LptD [Gillisia mitskevichiae]RKS53132.1 lipopolysaccharide assembly outer membrane protein LptD (OstA) [Gillisia mitskevichiae]